jgi:hypothetical protein
VAGCASCLLAFLPVATSNKMQVGVVEIPQYLHLILPSCKIVASSLYSSATTVLSYPNLTFPTPI